ncbi:hypothetical protein EI94DRAFT_1705677 [Lactarius quietus]|nr:hypothetical protein EI94DRAFT_1705677 [Lactarius quietus]
MSMEHCTIGDPDGQPVKLDGQRGPLLLNTGALLVHRSTFYTCLLALRRRKVGNSPAIFTSIRNFSSQDTVGYKDDRDLVLHIMLASWPIPGAKLDEIKVQPQLSTTEWSKQPIPMPLSPDPPPPNPTQPNPTQPQHFPSSFGPYSEEAVALYGGFPFIILLRRGDKETPTGAHLWHNSGLCINFGTKEVTYDQFVKPRTDSSSYAFTPGTTAALLIPTTLTYHRTLMKPSSGPTGPFHRFG